MRYMIFDVSKVSVDVSTLRTSLDGTKVIYHENLTGEDLPTYSHVEILEILKSPEWCEQDTEGPPPLPPPTLEERLSAVEDSLLEIILGGDGE